MTTSNKMTTTIANIMHKRTKSKTPAITDIELAAATATTTTTTTTSPEILLEKGPVVQYSEHLLQPNGSVVGSQVAKAILPRFPDLLSTIPTPTVQRAAIDCIDTTKKPITHVELKQFIIDIGNYLHKNLYLGRGHRIAVILPNGPELAVAIMAISTYCCCVPLNAFGAKAELESDIYKASIDHIIGLHHSSNNTNTNTKSDIEEMAETLGIPFTGLIPDKYRSGLFRLVQTFNSNKVTSYQPPKNYILQQKTSNNSNNNNNNNNTGITSPVPPPPPSTQKSPRYVSNLYEDEADRSAGGGGGGFHSMKSYNEDDEYDDDEENNNYNETNPIYYPNQHYDEILLLFTSGTTGIKKLVPHLLQDVIIATTCIIISWKLTPNDTNCNLMPLFHVGGIIRQVYSPILSGGCVICCPTFDPNIFWSLLIPQSKFTWYYAAPTMHQLILNMGKQENYFSNYKPKLRMIANAAGGLLPSLARELRQSFYGANILPSYGMTECMPITSPPANYLLEKPGTSGVAVGPEIIILNTTTGKPYTDVCGKEGPICVRGEPCFRGYGKIYGNDDNDDGPNSNTFLPGGWFNTGDLGYLDAEGYLYITGRSKEVINRGGEIISPLEVEEAVLSHPAVMSCVAFSTQHSVLQEVVGLVVVPQPNMPRIDLPTLHEYLGEGRLTAPKWPQCLVYMDALPKSHTNKLLRVKLGKRFSLPELNDNMYSIEKTYQAVCPPIGTPVSVAIPCQRVSVNPLHVQRMLRDAVQTTELLIVPSTSKIGALICYVGSTVDRLIVVKQAREKLHAYLVPSHVCVCLTGLVDEFTEQLQPPLPSDAVGSILQEEISKGQGPSDPLVLELQETMQILLDLDCLPAPDTNFFNMGGSSMMASQLASKVRKLYNVPFGGAEVFQASSCNAIASIVRERQTVNNGNNSANNNGGGGGGGENASQSKQNNSMVSSSLHSLKHLDLTKTPFEPVRMETNISFLGILFQLVPLLVIYPIYQLTRFFLFFRTLLWILVVAPGEHNLYKFVITLVVFHALWVTVTPLFFVLIKWVVIGKYRQGRYPIWSEYYLRWWFCDVLRKLIGRGSWGAHSETLNMYYRMLGANIGKNASISIQADIAEYDLVSIGDNACVEVGTVRGFGVDNGCMILGPVVVGNNSSVGARSVVAPYTAIPDNMHLGAVTSSYEITAPNGSNIEHLKVNRQALPRPTLLSQMFIISPITFLVDTLSHFPALGVLYLMVCMQKSRQPFDTIGDMFEWLADPRRIPFYVAIRVARSILAPLFYMLGAILVKWCIIGKFKAGPRNTNSEWQLIRHELAATLFSRENMQNVTDLVGRHYELVSVLYRLLGAKVGKRVFWPGRQPVFTGEFDLLEIGDDVVFGSRSALFCTTVDSCEKIILCAGSNCSDNTVVMPGSILGKGAVLGSNSLCPPNRYLPEGSVWLGAVGGEPLLLEKGTEESNRPMQSTEIDTDKLQMEGDKTTLRPFGRAFYNREANYFVLPLFMINLFTIFVRVLCATLGTFTLLASLHLTAGYFYGWPIYNRNYVIIHVNDWHVFMVMICFYMLTHFVHTIIWLILEITSRWLLIGQRQEGRFNYDTSDYAQRWELYQIFGKIREAGKMNFLDFLCGTPFMSTFFRLLGCKIGNDCCLYPTGGDPYMPEPDLVEMGDRCIIDCASVVCHLNTRGNFELAKITMQNNVTLRTRSRIQQGVHMESGSMLLEKSLALTGEIIEADTIWLGSPAARLMSYDVSSIGTRPSDSYPGSNVELV